jgi:hypothetical protein
MFFTLPLPRILFELLPAQMRVFYHVAPTCFF